jgi:hypothetical protein
VLTAESKKYFVPFGEKSKLPDSSINIKRDFINDPPTSYYFLFWLYRK